LIFQRFFLDYKDNDHKEISMDLRQRIKADVEKIFPRLVEIRRDIHAHPELGYKEERTSGLVASELEKIGIEVQRHVAKTGVVGLLQGQTKGRTVAIRGDMDALPIREENRFVFRSTADGVMHACGHDAHTAMVLGAAMVLATFRENVKGKVKFLFEPSEEKNPPGAQAMVKQGVLRNPIVDAIFGLHVDPGSPSGTLGFLEGPMMAAADEVRITIHGKSAHGSQPQRAIDPIMIMAQVIIELQAVISRHRHPNDPSVLSFGKIRGGDVQNVIPDAVEICGTLRTMNKQWRQVSQQLIKRTAEGIAQLHGGSASVEFLDGACTVINDTAVTSFARQCAIDYAGKEKVYQLSPVMTAETFGYFLQKVPGVLFRLGVADKRKGVVHDLHTPRFSIAENSMKTGAGFFAYLTIEYLRSH
jgi:amidohydrolase